MADFEYHTIDTAPAASKPQLEGSLKDFGMIPNLHAVMAEAPKVLEGYRFLHEAFQQTSLTVEEQTVVWQAINVEHGCHYCVPAHTGLAHMMKVDPAVTEALRNQTPLPTAKLEALRTFTLSVLRNRGVVSDDEVQAFLDAGFTRQNVLEVVLGLAQKVMSNYINHLATTPVDKPFQKFAWEKPVLETVE
ncbi:carboxymuconolactone decarboxylase family protein [Rhodobacteraceae bacterium NNCM2]|nr:carboxymuconolactone decarboxylase family protein [Coraliihabitans acroporae]